MSNEALKLAKSVSSDTTTKEVVVTIRDGSRHAWPVRLLEMVESKPDAWVLLENITEQQLADVKIYGGGQYVLWDGLGQVFSVANLLSGIYGREAWMNRLMATVE